MKENVSFNTKLEVAVEVISAKIANMSNKGYTVEDEEMKKLINEREQMYLGNETVIDKIINVYGTELRKIYKGEEN